MTRRLVVALAVLASALSACAARSYPVVEQEHAQQEIVMLHGKILEWRRELGLGPTPAPRDVDLFYTEPSRAATPGATPMSVPEPCRDVCTLGDYICQAADDICRIAADLPSDDWARRKCASAKASCTEARARCSRCCQ